MIKIKVNDNTEDESLVDPITMVGTEHGTIFQQYHNGEPCKDYYISCGRSEQSVIHIWYNEENGEYNLSTDNFKSLKSLVDTVKVKEIDATIDINLITGE